VSTKGVGLRVRVGVSYEVDDEVLGGQVATHEIQFQAEIFFTRRQCGRASCSMAWKTVIVVQV
jgi:hypothetical protein